MASVNKVILVGNLGNDPEVRTMNNGSVVTTINIATSERYKDKDTGQYKETTEWHKIVMFNRLAEIAQQHLKKGSAIYIEGKIKTSKYKGKDGIERYSTEIICDSMQMLGKKDNQVHETDKEPVRTSHTSSRNAYQDVKDGLREMKDDIPF